jgi:site-specific recombinase XerD
MQKTKELVNNPISDEALELIGERGTGLVFVGFADKMTQAPLKYWLKAAGITKKISFHCSRHTFGSLQVDAGTSVYTVQHMLGHKNVSTTQIYAAMADESKRESVNRITLKPMKTVQLKVVGQ